MRLRVQSAAQAELDEAALWYEEQRAGLGQEFLAAAAVVFRRLLEHPEQHQIVHRDLRRAGLGRFPYAIFYRVVDGDIKVVACMHSSRDPRRWQSR